MTRISKGKTLSQNREAFARLGAEVVATHGEFTLVLTRIHKNWFEELK